MYSLLYFVPKNLLSHLFGRLASVRLPRFAAAWVNKTYARIYGVDLSEAEYPPEHYPSLQAFFTRNLKAGLRPIGEGIVAPVDGDLTSAGEIENELLIQAKGRFYTLGRLLGDDASAAYFRGGFFYTFYLAPKDYHHIHAPVDGEVESCRYIPGKLWPVNSWSVPRIEELFAVNERIVSIIKTPSGRVAVVKVGATNVGSISLSFDKHRSNNFVRAVSFAPQPKSIPLKLPVKVSRGERIASFNLGSTVILLLERPGFVPVEPIRYGQVHYGETIGRWG